MSLFLTTFLQIIIVEFLNYKQNERKFVELDGVSRIEPSIYELLWQLYNRLVPFIFGALISQMTTDIAKYSIGRLRPHFLAVCEPRWNYNGVTYKWDSECTKDAEHTYIEDYTCTTTQFSEDRIRDAHLSFMSGHSSFSAFCLIYLVVSPTVTQIDNFILTFTSDISPAEG